MNRNKTVAITLAFYYTKSLKLLSALFLTPSLVFLTSLIVNVCLSSNNFSLSKNSYGHPSIKRCHNSGAANARAINELHVSLAFRRIETFQKQAKADKQIDDFAKLKCRQDALLLLYGLKW